MQTDKPLLTIAIPTYSRAVFLDRLLSDLSGQLSDRPEVELLISDNASLDNTCELVKQHQQRGLRLRYLRNETNLGPDVNILQCYQRALGKYVWIFSDDDLLRPGTVARILKSLMAKDYDIVGIRAKFFPGDLPSEDRFTPRADLEFTEAADFARNFHIYMTFISGIILNKERITLNLNRALESLVGTNLVQLGPVYTALNCHRESLLIRDPLVMAQGSDSVGYSLFRIFGTNLASITSAWVDREAVRRAILNGVLLRFFPFSISNWRRGKLSKSEEDPDRVLRPVFGLNFRYWLFDYPLYRLPLPLVQVWLFLVRAINKCDAMLGSPLVR